MCGFFGSINGDTGKMKKVRELRHRGPDSDGEHRDGALYLRHFRLAILGEEPFARQPMLSRDGRIMVAFNGEIYNYKEIAGYLGETDLANDGDTRVLTEFLSRYGMERLDMLNGMFAMAVYDREKKELYLVRDRFGIKPLYYMRIGDSFYFASEIKCFMDIKALSMNRKKVLDYLDMGAYPFGKETFYDGITQVEAGSLVKYSGGILTEKMYYDLREECRRLSERDLGIDEYESLLAESIKLRLRSDVPIALHYSGGTDSTALLLKTKEVWGWDYPLVAYTMAYSEQEFDEARLTRKYCGGIGVENPAVLLSPEEVPDMAREVHYFEDEPYGGIPVIAYYKLNKAERESGYIVSIEGQGGDEAFGGYLYHAFMAMYDLHREGRDPQLLERLLAANGTTVEEVVSTAERLIGSGFSAHTDLTDFRSGDKRPEIFMDWLRTIQMYDIARNKIPRVLRFHDRASMACGREVRFPLLDHNVLAYGLAFGHEEKFREGMSKYPLRMIIKRHMKGVYSVPKRSVVTPQTSWLRNELREWAVERVRVLKKADILPEEYFRKFDGFYSGEDNSNSFYIWQLINLSFFFEKEKVPAAG